jgi:cytochrome c-type biogenesis protein CcmH
MLRVAGKARMLSLKVVSLFSALVAAALMSVLATPTWANEAAPASADPVLEKKMTEIAAELRCLVCQNQTIADSNADLAVDLRRQVREMLQQGKGQQEILDYMTARYGDFVLYRPPLKGTTAVLWFAPGVLLVFGAVVLVIVLRRRARLSDDAFEADDVPMPALADDPNAEPPATRPLPSSR